MTELCLGLALFLLVTIVLGLIRIRRGPSDADRMLSAQLFGTTGVAILLLLGQATDRTFWWDVALVFALLSAVTAIAFVSRNEPSETAQQQRDDHGS
ncbi:monovalent cation/H+ antiporter complex subunit F [Desulfofustis glycolicus]|uniref:Multisubunit sodium/proton antiporter, MrpF subunit (TC 2.A.63.1) n=1 Tax=Desulfofustis glycolicus DSM 9705 TaxID=1121409 RepID=A0A1M5SLR2_9BACT|nr:monovalent cation/H+ antiporter complex subunit F [Desulfofustis glycolicus]MCB2215663.1 multiple resistance and pH regulation protein F [Desulfobulbaceae bacterium]SHH39188.1 multisubunit sodium/proton antiporter, MrpF subunit (TC 2.A.63.1) [Desulfofustis glycolicus DSM 9705]